MTKRARKLPPAYSRDLYTEITGDDVLYIRERYNGLGRSLQQLVKGGPHEQLVARVQDLEQQLKDLQKK